LASLAGESKSLTSSSKKKEEESIVESEILLAVKMCFVLIELDEGMRDAT
jgi:hypothetical protein